MSDQIENLELEDFKAQAMQALYAKQPDEVLRLANVIFAKEEKLYGPTDPRTALSLDNLAGAYARADRTAEAIEALNRALVILAQAGGDKGPEVRLNQHLGELYARIADAANAKQHYEHCLNLSTAAFGASSHEAFEAAKQLGAFCFGNADFPGAESALLIALKAGEQIYGKSAPELLDPLNRLYLLYRNSDDLETAKAFCLRAVEICNHAPGVDPLLRATTFNNFGVLLYHQGHREKSAEHLQSAFQVRAAILGPNHPKTLDVANNLAMTFEKLGRYSDAVPLLERAMEVNLRAYGPADARTIRSLSNLALLQAELGDYSKAESLIRPALEANSGQKETLMGSQLLHNAAILYLTIGNMEEALELAKQDAELRRRRAAMLLSFTSQRARLEFFRSNDHFMLSASIGDPWLVASDIIHFKGLVFDSILEDRAVWRASQSPNEEADVQSLDTATQRLGELLFSEPSDLDRNELESREKEKVRLQKEIDVSESKLARHFASTGATRRALGTGVDHLMSAIPVGSVLVEYLWFTKYVGSGKFARYCGALLLNPSSSPQWIPIGEEEPLKESIVEYIQCFNGVKSDAEVAEVLKRLFREFWLPVERCLPPATNEIVICPDADLHLVSFATLMDEADRFLIERYSFRYVDTGRDLIPTPAPSPTHDVKDIAIFANPDFGAAAGQNSASRKPSDGAAKQKLAAIKFTALPHTETEANAVERIATSAGWRVARFDQKQVTEANLGKIAAPYVLHIATHGFLLPHMLERDVSGAGGKAPYFLLSDPLMRSGLALSGAQDTIESWRKGTVPTSSQDGIFTALDAAGLNLRGTQLVTLSACDSAVGEIRPGEGVWGVRRGFIQAGAKHLVMVLWAAHDRITADMMAQFYGLVIGQDILGALMQMQKKWLSELRQKSGLRRAFICAGPFIVLTRA
jgi:CHAT domain-containing protein/tetratricopeptide (TPR) repeat protein